MEEDYNYGWIREKKDPNDFTEAIIALHIEGPSDIAYEIRAKLSKWYSSASKVFPDDTNSDSFHHLIPFYSLKTGRNLLH